MKNPNLIRGTLLKRYNRFLADVKLERGRIVTAHCPNTGSMLTCSAPGSPVYLSEEENPNRKYRYTWELIYINDTWVGVNTLLPNKLVFRAVKKGQVPELVGYPDIQKEVKYGVNSRIDLLLRRNGEKCYVEVKNVTLAENGVARFPDAVTTRGAKHLQELMDMVDQGHRAVMFFLVQRGDVSLFRPAEDIDPEYAEALKRAHEKGVEILVYQAEISLEEINLGKRLPIEL